MATTRRCPLRDRIGETGQGKETGVGGRFCWRYDPPRRELFQRMHDGAIGDIRAIYATYYTGPVKRMRARQAPPGDGRFEWQMRNWYNFVWICGDGYVEQACHSVDKTAWALKDASPIKAVAVGAGRRPTTRAIFSITCPSFTNLRTTCACFSGSDRSAIASTKMPIISWARKAWPKSRTGFPFGASKSGDIGPPGRRLTCIRWSTTSCRQHPQGRADQ